MSYFLGDDQLFQNRKFTALMRRGLEGDTDAWGAVALWLMVGSACKARYSTGKVSLYDLLTIAPDPEQAPRLAGVLVEVGLWHDADHPCHTGGCKPARRGEYIYHDWMRIYKKTGDQEREERAMTEERNSASLKAQVWERDRLPDAQGQAERALCAYCCRPVFRKAGKGPERAEIDHVIPKPLGVDNLVICHARCNKSKGNRNPAQAGLSLHLTDAHAAALHERRASSLPTGIAGLVDAMLGLAPWPSTQEAGLEAAEDCSHPDGSAGQDGRGSHPHGSADPPSRSHPEGSAGQEDEGRCPDGSAGQDGRGSHPHGSADPPSRSHPDDAATRPQEAQGSPPPWLPGLGPVPERIGPAPGEPEPPDTPRTSPQATQRPSAPRVGTASAPVLGPRAGFYRPMPAAETSLPTRAGDAVVPASTPTPDGPSPMDTPGPDSPTVPAPADPVSSHASRARARTGAYAAARGRSHGRVRAGMARHGMDGDGKARPGTAGQGTAQPGTAQPGTAQHGTAQPGTEQARPGRRRRRRRGRGRAAGQETMTRTQETQEDS